jgi:hypothetical protein
MDSAMQAARSVQRLNGLQRDAEKNVFDCVTASAGEKSYRLLSHYRRNTSHYSSSTQGTPPCQYQYQWAAPS